MMITEKKSIDDLAIFSGTPAFRETLHVGRPYIGNRQQLFARLNQVLDRNWLTNNGPMVKEFEKRICKLLGVRNCVAMCNGTIALEIAVRALGLTGEVIVPSFTFVATAHCLQWQEITPVFCDIDPKTHNIDTAKIEQLITPRTTAILGVHLWGRPCAINNLQKIARKYNLRLIFDASHAFGCSYKKRMIGNWGDAETFSFHATKFINCFEGGAVVTNNDDLAHKMRLMKNFGFEGLDCVIHIGTNGKMNEASAAMGLTSLESMNDFITTNQHNFNKYYTHLSIIPGIKILEYDESEKNNFQYVVCEIDQDKFGISRNQLISILDAENIRARRYFYPGCHKMEPYVSYYPGSKFWLQETEKVSDKVLCLPTGNSITNDHIGQICSLIKFVNDNCEMIRERIDIAE